MSERFSREVLRLTLHGTLRPEKYPDLDTLKTQIVRDCEAAKSFLMDHRNA